MHNNNIIIINNHENFMVLASRPKSLWEFTQFNWWMWTERRVAANPQTKPVDLDCESDEKWLLPSTSKSTIAIFIITQPVNWCSFYRPTEVSDWVDLGTAVKVRSPCPRLYITATVAINRPAAVRFEPESCQTAVGRANHSATWSLQYSALLQWAK